MDSSCDTACAVGCPIRRSQGPRVLASRLSFSQRATSFIASRYQGIHQMPFSSSSPTPSPKRALRALGRRQRSEGSRQRSFLLPSAFCHLPSGADAQASPMLAHRRSHTHAQVQPRRTAGPASRSRLASRCRRSDGREQKADHIGPPRLSRHDSRPRRQKSGPRLLPSALLPSEPGGPGPTRTADLTLIRRAL
jgi:hypothetical protein